MTTPPPSLYLHPSCHPRFQLARSSLLLLSPPLQVPPTRVTPSWLPRLPHLGLRHPPKMQPRSSLDCPPAQTVQPLRTSTHPYQPPHPPQPNMDPQSAAPKTCVCTAAPTLSQCAPQPWTNRHRTSQFPLEGVRVLDLTSRPRPFRFRNLH